MKQGAGAGIQLNDINTPLTEASHFCPRALNCSTSMCYIHIDPAKAQTAVGIVSIIKQTQIWDKGTEAGMPAS